MTTGAVQTYLADNLPWAGAQLPFRIADANGNPLQIGNALSAGDFGVVDPDHNSVVTQSGNAISVFKPSGSGIAAGMYLTRPLPSGAVIQLVACVDAGANNNSAGGLQRHWLPVQHDGGCLPFAMVSNVVPDFRSQGSNRNGPSIHPL